MTEMSILPTVLSLQWKNKDILFYFPFYKSGTVTLSAWDDIQVNNYTVSSYRNLIIVINTTTRRTNKA